LHCKIGAARGMRPGCRVVHRVVSNGSGYGVITITARRDFQVGWLVAAEFTQIGTICVLLDDDD
jgi:hypothetical protein